MKVLYNWLKELVSLEIPPEEVARTLTLFGLEVSQLETRGVDVRNVVVGEILEISPHPNADRLTVCRVTAGQQPLEIICGAKNIRVGDRVPVALVGARLPGGLAIEPSKIRGVMSQGMLCSAQELGVPEQRPDGILTLPQETPLGLDVGELLGLRDTILEVDVTPNRPDCLSHLGIARELATVLKHPLKLPEARLRELPGIEPLPINVKDPLGCPRYIGRVIRDVTVAPSPPWLIQRLTYCGFRPINNIVDITNYVLLEAGHPLHAFNLARLGGSVLVVRRAHRGEVLTSLDGERRQLDEDTLIIADEERPVALAGIIGGSESAVSPETQEVFLESALFDPPLIRRTARRLGIRTESSYRFERGIGWESAAWASQRAAALIQELAGGKVSKAQEVASKPWAPVTIDLRLKRAERLLGVALDSAAAAESLRRLQFTIEPTKSADTLKVTVPPHRVDVTQEIDLLEELARVYGYHEIPVRYPRLPPLNIAPPPLWRLEQLCREVLIGLGHLEAVTSSFLNQTQAVPFLPGDPPQTSLLAPMNPLSEDWAVLRPSLLPGLLACVTANLRRQAPTVRLFEVGRVFWRTGEHAGEGRRVAWVLAGEDPPHWQHPSHPLSLYTVTGLCTHLMTALGISDGQWGATSAPWLHPGPSAQLTLHGEVIAVVGQVHPRLMALWDCPVIPWLGELDLESLARWLPSPRRFTPPPRFPAVLRDLAIVLNETIPYSRVEQTLRTAAGKILEQSRLFDVYHGEQIDKGKRSLALTLTFRHPQRTLTDTEIDHLLQHLRETLKQELGALPR